MNLIDVALEQDPLLMEVSLDCALHAHNSGCAPTSRRYLCLFLPRSRAASGQRAQGELSRDTPSPPPVIWELNVRFLQLTVTSRAPGSSLIRSGGPDLRPEVHRSKWMESLCILTPSSGTPLPVFPSSNTSYPMISKDRGDVDPITEAFRHTVQIHQQCTPNTTVT